MKKILITGTGGFIGFHLAKHLLDTGRGEVLGIDVLNDYYDPELKAGRLEQLGLDKARLNDPGPLQSSRYPFRFWKLDLCHKEALFQLLEKEKPDVVVHLAAQAGVRYSLTHPEAYLHANMEAFLNMIEGMRKIEPEHFVYASSSSVYGLNSEIPFSTQHSTVHPVSLYAATKRSNELMAHAYSHLFRIPTTGLRFFTVYGPWGRPDMALFLFTEAILKGKPIDVYNHGNMRRDFTYIDDIVKGIEAVMDKPAQPDSSFNPLHPQPDISSAPFRVLNIGHSSPVNLMDYVHEIEKQLGIKAEINPMPLQPGDVLTSYADVSELITEYGYKPNTSIETGVAHFVRWYKSYYQVK